MPAARHQTRSSMTTWSSLVWPSGPGPTAAGFPSIDGSYSAWQPRAAGIYRAELAAHLRQLGYRTYRESRYFEVGGISARLREAFSPRSDEGTAAVRRFMQERGRPRPSQSGRP
jgi:hypothetical protein